MTKPDPNQEVETSRETEVKIRTATVKEVGNFYTHVWKTIYGGGSFPALLDWGRLAECDEYFVAEDNGEIIGAITLAVQKNRRPPTLDTVYLIPSHRGRGIGRRLCETAMLRFKEAQKAQVVCDVTSRKMHRTIELLPTDLRAILRPILSYQTYGDAWE